MAGTLKYVESIVLLSLSFEQRMSHLWTSQRNCVRKKRDGVCLATRLAATGSAATGGKRTVALCKIFNTL